MVQVPQLPVHMYLFVAPLLVPVVTPLVSVASIWGQWRALAVFLALGSAGLAAKLWLFVNVSGTNFFFFEIHMP